MLLGQLINYVGPNTKAGWYECFSNAHIGTRTRLVCSKVGTRQVPNNPQSL
jgi:hypothetical protein